MRGIKVTGDLYQRKWAVIVLGLGSTRAIQARQKVERMVKDGRLAKEMGGTYREAIDAMVAGYKRSRYGDMGL
jgi:hypothetical protein